MAKNVTKGLLALVFIGIFSQSAMAATVKAPPTPNPADRITRENKWELAEALFVTEPEHKIRTSWEILLKKVFGTTAVGAAPGTALATVGGLATATSALVALRQGKHRMKDARREEHGWSSNKINPAKSDRDSDEESPDFEESQPVQIDHPTASKPQLWQSAPLINKIITGACVLPIVAGVAAVPAGIALAAFFIPHMIEKTVYRNVFKLVVTNWESTYKNLMPVELHEVFGTMAQEYARLPRTKQAAYLKQVSPEATEKIKRVIYGQFPEKYAHRLALHDAPKTWAGKLISPKTTKFLLTGAGAAGVAVVTAAAFKLWASGLVSIGTVVNELDH